MTVFCSTIIPTVGRQTLSRAVCSALNQHFSGGETEVIVVNDSGRPLPEQEWSHSDRVRTINTNRRERSFARNAGASIACGRFLHFLDDDDCLLPGAMGAFWELSQHSCAPWLYGGYRTVDNDGQLIEEFRPRLPVDAFAMLVSGEAIPLQPSLILARHFVACGGFDLDPQLIGVEDRDLGRRLAFRGELASTQAIVAQIRIGPETSTTNWDAIAERDRLGRERSLSLSGAAMRLRALDGSPYWRGRVSRAYLASMIWNLQHRAVDTAAARAATAVVMAAPSTLSASFWRGMRTKIK